jgi:hypothetical protein
MTFQMEKGDVQLDLLALGRVYRPLALSGGTKSALLSFQ